MNDARPDTRQALARLARLARKELSEILRDRRTIFTLVLMPVLLYPLLSMAFQQYFLAHAPTEAVTEYRVGVANQDQAHFAGDFLTLGEFEAFQRPATAAGLAASPGGWGPLLSVPPLLTTHTGRQVVVGSRKIIFLKSLDLEKDLRDREIDVGLRMGPKSGGPQKHLAIDWQLVYAEHTPRSTEALLLVDRLLSQSNAAFLQRQLPALGVQQRATPVRLFRVAIEQEPPPEGLSLAALIPLILILMTITGAVYPAIDLTAGERERGTLEILVAAPVPRLALLFAKYVSVVTVALLTAVVNLVMMLGTLQLSGLSRLLFGEAGLSPLVVLQMFALLVLFALFFSALLLALTSFARSFKEAQAYLIPLMIVALAPGVAGLIPGLKLTGMLTVVPLLNIVLLSRDLLQGGADPMLAGVVVASTLLYAAAAVGIAARVFGAEAVLYSEQSGWSDLFRRPRESRPTAAVSSALLCLALMFPLTFVLNNLIARLSLEGLSPRDLLAVQIGLVVAVSILLFGLLPVAAAGMGHVRFTSGFGLRPPPPLALLGGLLLGVSLWPFVIEFLAWMQQLGLTTLGQHHADRIVQRLRDLRQTFPAPLVVAVVVLPAIVEEWFFRGFLFAALRSVLKPWPTILLSALLFGLFHLIVTDAFSLERLLPSTLLGVILGWVCYRGGSVLPCMLLHACHNGLLVGVSYTDFAREPHLPPEWLVGAAVVALVGGGLMLLARPRESPTRGA